MKRIHLLSLFATIVSLLAGVNCLAAETAQSVLNHVVDRMGKQPVEAHFDISASGVNQKGSIILSGNKFVILTDELSTWYDGKTQWTLAHNIKEVNITNPTKEELAEINPLYILSALSSNFDCTLADGNNTAKLYELYLTSRKKDSGISSARVFVNAATWFPSRIIIDTTTGQQFTIVINTIKNINKPDNALFKFNKNDHPGVEIIDMR